jgi:MFS family permease
VIRTKEGQPNSNKGIRANLLKMNFFSFFTNLHFIGGVLIPFFMDWGGLNMMQIMILQSWFMLWTFVLEIPSGAVADYLGRKFTLVLACVINIAGAIMYASFPNFYVFLFGEAIWAVAAALLSGAREAFIYDTLKDVGEPEKSKAVFARIDSFRLAGVMIGAPLGSFIAVRFGLNAPMLFITLPLVVASLIGITFEEPARTQKIRKKYTQILKDGIEYFLKNRVLKILALDMIFIASVAYFMIWFYQPMLELAGVDVAYFGFVHASFVVSQIVIMNNYERLETLLGSKKRLITFSALITGIMFIVGGLTSLIPIVLMVITVGGGFGLSRRPLFLSYMNKFISSSERATVLSAISMIRRLALVAINPFVGMMADWSLSYTLIILGVLAVFFSLISRVKEEHLID